MPVSMCRRLLLPPRPPRPRLARPPRLAPPLPPTPRGAHPETSRRPRASSPSRRGRSRPPQRVLHRRHLPPAPATATPIGTVCEHADGRAAAADSCAGRTSGHDGPDAAPAGRAYGAFRASPSPVVVAMQQRFSRRTKPRPQPRRRRRSSQRATAQPVLRHAGPGREPIPHPCLPVRRRVTPARFSCWAVGPSCWRRRWAAVSCCFCARDGRSRP